MNQTHAYRGYLIHSFPRNPAGQQWSISKGGHHIGWARSEADARAIVEMVAS